VKRFSLAAMLAVVLFAGCAARQVQIAELKDRPTKYNDKSVRVTGRVTNSFGIPLVPFQVYNVDDGTGEIALTKRPIIDVTSSMIEPRRRRPAFPAPFCAIGVLAAAVIQFV
jgi:hypothetical protein